MPAMASDLTLHDQHARDLPLPLAQLYRSAHNALDPEEKHRHAFDLWDWSIRLLGAAAVVEYQARGADGAKVGDLLARLDRLTLGSWWRLVCVLVDHLQDDAGFAKVNDVLLKKPQRGTPRAAALQMELIRALGGSAGPRVVVNLRELVDTLINYRNRKIGHPDEMRSGELFAKVGPALLGGAIDFLEHVDVLAGRKLTYIADVRQDNGRWRIVRMRLAGLAAGNADTIYRPIAEAERLPNAGETYLESPDGSLRSIGMLASFDAATQSFSFRPAAQPTPSESVLPPRLNPSESGGPQQCSFDDFQLLTRLGAGGAGAVFRARQLSVDRDVALKCILRPDTAAEQRFLREVAALGHVTHPNLARIYAYGAAGVQCYYSMELVEGADLARIMQHLIRGADGEVNADEWVHAVTTACEHARAAETKLDGESDSAPPQEPAPTPPPDLRAGPQYIRQVVTLIAQVADAAHALHEAQPGGIIHRDIKPSNIVVSPDGDRAVLVDLGLALLPDDSSDRAKLTRTRQFVGTARYASPEQIFDAHRVDRRTDVYSLGATLWELLSLRPLFGGAGDDPSFDRAMSVAGSVRSHNARVPADLDAVVRKCLSPDKTKRYSSAGELSADLHRWLAGEPVTAQPPTLRYIWSLHVRKHKWRLAVTAVALFALVAGTIGAFYFVNQQRQLAVTALREKEESLEREKTTNEQLSVRNRALQQFNDVTYRLFGGSRAGPSEDARTLYRTLAIQSVQNSADQGDLTNALSLAELLIDREEESYAQEMLGVLRKLQQKQPDDARIHGMLGACHAILKQYEEADRCFHESLRRDAAVPSTYGWRAQSRTTRKMHDEALTDYSEAIRLDPQNPSRWHHRGNFYYNVKEDYPRAVADYSEAIRLKPEEVLFYGNRGNAYARNKETDKALADFTEAIRIDPGSATVWNGRGTCYHNEKRDYKQAVHDYSAAIRLAPTNALYLTNRGNSLRLLREYDRAIADYSEVIRLRPNDSTSYSLRGRVYFDREEYDRAIADYSEAIKLAPKVPDSHNSRGACKENTGDYAGAIVDYTEAIKLNPKEPLYLTNRGNARRLAKQWDKAIADYSEALRIEPKADRYALRASAQVAKGSYEAAIADLTTAIQLEPREAQFWASRGDAYAAAKDLDKALADHAKAIELDPKNAYRWNNRGVIHDVHRKDYSAAIADYSQAIQLQPKVALYHYNRGNAHFAAREIDKALLDYTESLNLEPQNAVRRNKRGLVFFNQKHDYARAIADYTEALRLEKGVAAYWSNRGDAYKAMKDFARAVEDYTEAIRLEPNKEYYYNDRAIANYEAQRYDAAIEDYSASFKLSPKSAIYVSNRGLAYKAKKDYDRAIADMQDAIRLDPENPERRRNCGDVRVLKGDYDGAIMDFSEAIRLAPANAEFRSLRGDVYRLHKRDYARAIADYTVAIQHRPNDAALFRYRGLCFTAQREYDSALADYTTSLKLRPGQAAVLYRRGQAYSHLAKLKEALADFDESLKIDPENPDCWNERGTVFHNHLREYNRAIADYSVAIKLKPDNAMYWTNRAGSSLRVDDIDAALGDYGQAIRLNPNDPYSFNAMGNLYHNHKREYVKAVDNYTKAIKLAPQSAVYHTNRANSLTELREYAKAMQDYNEALRINPKLVEALRNRAWLHADVYQNHAAAHADYETAIAAEPNNSTSLHLFAWHLATCPIAAFRDGPRSVEYAQRAVQLTGGRSASFADTCAAAFAEMGDFERAMQWEAAALAAVREIGDRAAYANRLRMYRLRQPMRVL